jgi:predicted dehydrogenase/threonine dehydrogenase-like Zn-dependent dehydrogenase
MDMKQVAQNYRSGELSVLDVPPPACQPGGVLVRSLYSLISTGTEMMKVSEARLSLVGKARARPDQVRKVVDTVAEIGPMAAYKKAASRLDSYTPLGYSVCGRVIEVGRDVRGFAAGQLVACAGNDHALHAEVNWVPENLCVPVPDGVAPDLAAFATVGAIALHGVRRAEAQLGETACVIGLGLVGQLVVQILVAAGVRVVGLDVVAARCELAEHAGAIACAAPSPEGLDRIGHVLTDLTGGLGADHVFLAAGGTSNTPVHAAALLARDRARVVDIGKCRLDLPWNSYYEKELDVRFSRSYGPGRYDDHYELDGADYPPGYVRWTERRNLACFLDLVARGQVSIRPLMSDVFPIADAVSVYDGLNQGQLHGVGFLFKYPEPVDEPSERSPAPALIPERSPRAVPGRPVKDKVRLGFIGAGNYASSVLLPYLATFEGVELAHVATTTSLSAANTQRKFGFVHASTDADAVLSDGAVDAVFVVTRHHSHARLACRALEAGKTVYVEKPLALSAEELDLVLNVIAATSNDRVMVGFNRRFAPLFVNLKARFEGGGGGSLAHYSVNAGPLSSGSWYRRRELEGSRFEGEGGHFIDTLSWWLDALPIQVHAMGIEDIDDVAVTIRFDEGSVANVTYATNGNARYPKETFSVAALGRSARLDNFRRATLWRGRRRHTKRSMGAPDKGQRQQLEHFIDAVRSGGAMPIPLSSLVATTRATLAVRLSLATGVPVTV